MPPGFPLSRRHFLGHMLVSLSLLPPRAKAQPLAEDGFQIIEARPGKLRLLPEPQQETEIWGFDGQVPGPLLRFKKGKELKIRLVNKLDQPLTLHWHGMRGPNAMAGVGALTQAPVSPGGSFNYRFVPPDSGLFWYHSHVLPLTGDQLDRGLYGGVIVEESEPPQADKDLLLILSDWRLDSSGTIENGFIDRQTAMGIGRIGSLLTINAKPGPLTETLPPGSRVRLRIISAMDARVMFLGFEGLRPRIIAVDGMPCDEAFEPVRQTIPAGPGACFDLLLDLPETEETETRLVLRGENAPDQPLLLFKTAKEPSRATLPPIPSLPQNPLLPIAIPLQSAFRLDLTIDGGEKPEPDKAVPTPNQTQASQTAASQASAAPAKTNGKDKSAKSAPPPAMPQANPPPNGQSLFWSLNGISQSGFAQKPLFSVKRGSAVTLGFINRSAFVQQMRIHGHCFRLLHDLDDGWEPYWRNAVLVPPGRTKHLAFIADNPGKWVIESLMASRQSTGLATWFEVT